MDKMNSVIEYRSMNISYIYSSLYKSAIVSLNFSCNKASPFRSTLCLTCSTLSYLSSKYCFIASVLLLIYSHSWVVNALGYVSYYLLRQSYAVYLHLISLAVFVQSFFLFLFILNLFLVISFVNSL